MKLEIKNLSKSYGEKRALKNLSVTMEEGVYALLGPNGAGKSTLINLLTDSVKRDAGQICWDGKEILSMGREYRALLGYMPQQQRLYEHYTAEEFLKYMAAVKGLKGKKTGGQIEHLLHVVNLWEVRKKKVGGFSGGMKQRVLLAQALLGEPKLLILDEPTAGLDPNERINLRNYIAELSENMIILFATHVVSDIESIAKQVLLLRQGELRKSGSPAELTGELREIQMTEEAVSLEDVYRYYM